MDISKAIEALRASYSGDKPATLEDMAAACGIDVEAPFSYREVVEMAEALALSPHVCRLWTGGVLGYFASSPPRTP